MKLTAEEFRKKLSSWEIMGDSKRLRFAAGRTISKTKEQGQAKQAETKPQPRSERNEAKTEAVKPKVHRQLAQIDRMLTGFGISFEKEFYFAPGRKYRADRYLPDHNILIEFEGIGFTRSGDQKKTRHTSLIGYTNDCTKYNLATELGFKVFRYTAKNYLECSKMLERLVAIDR